MARGPLWTKREDRVLLNQVRKNPNNLKEAFRKASNLLERRDWVSCSKRWYSKFSNCSPDNIDAICFTTLSSKTMSINTKNKHKRTKSRTYKVNKTFWGKFKEFINRLF